MTEELPRIGAREGLTLEFKRPEKLREKRGRQDLVRGVVAMRNASGGDIWVGVVEHGDEFGGFQPLAETDREHVTALRDTLVDRVEPRLSIGRDVTLVEIPIAGGRVLRIRVRPKAESDAPACFVDGSSREFLERTGSRIAPIAHSRLFPAPSRGRAEPVFADRALALHREWVEQWKGKAEGLLTVSVVPSDDLDGDLDAWSALLRDPPPDVVGASGATWHAGRYGSVSKRSDRLIQSPRNHDDVYCRLEVRRTGRLHFCTHRDWLAWRGTRFSDEPEDLKAEATGRLDARALVGIVASTLRLAARLSSEFPSRGAHGDARATAVVSLLGLKGWLWPLGHPDAFHTFFRRHWLLIPGEDVTVLVDRDANEFAATPDVAALALLTKIYEQCAHDSLESVLPRHIVWFNERKQFVPPQ